MPIDATRGLRDWADDTHALVRALNVGAPPHLVGWSTGAAAIAAYAIDRPVASLTFVGPVSPYIADGSAWDMGTLGSLGAVPGWPGADAFPPQPMVTQTRRVPERYGGRVEVEAFEGSGHFPVVDAADRWAARFFAFLANGHGGDTPRGSVDSGLDQR